MPKKKYFAIKKGVKTGVFHSTWNEMEPLVKGYPGAIYKSFTNKDEADIWFGNLGLNSINTTNESENVNNRTFYCHAIDNSYDINARYVLPEKYRELKGFILFWHFEGNNHFKLHKAAKSSQDAIRQVHLEIIHFAIEHGINRFEIATPMPQLFSRAENKHVIKMNTLIKDNQLEVTFSQAIKDTNKSLLWANSKKWIRLAK